MNLQLSEGCIMSSLLLYLSYNLISVPKWTGLWINFNTFFIKIFFVSMIDLQEKRLKELKKAGASKKQAEAKQKNQQKQKNKNKKDQDDDEPQVC